MLLFYPYVSLFLELTTHGMESCLTVIDFAANTVIETGLPEVLPEY